MTRRPSDDSGELPVPRTGGRVEVSSSFSRTIARWDDHAKNHLSDSLSALIWDACAMELNALKPGNVHRYANGHGMTLEDFLASALAIAPVISKLEFSLGERILQSIQATRQVVAMNTNLGIVLLCAPIVQAFHADSSCALQNGVKDVIDNTDREDTERILVAIRTASPSGLGTSSLHDVFEPASAGIRTVMQAAADQDMIARQYVNGFEEIFEFGFDALRESEREGRRSVGDITTGIYLAFLSKYHDSHIIRQHGLEIAEEVREAAQLLYSRYQRTECVKEIFELLMEYDSNWKNQDINPGTSADLTVATLIAWNIQNRVN